MIEVDVLVIGAGHAGIEAALASARMGCKTACVTLRLDRIGHLPCNCSIGGPAKGHIAREVDALGGQMAITTDFTLTHIRRVGTGKGPAVQTLRAHVCKTAYPEMMRSVFMSEPNLSVYEGLVSQILASGGEVRGAKFTPTGQQAEIEIRARSVVITSGTFLNAVCHEGATKTQAARHGDAAVLGISPFLSSLGVRLLRFKTGTTPRIVKSSIDFSQTAAMESHDDAGPFSYLHDQSYPQRELLPCWQTRTLPSTHEILQENLHRSAMYGGHIQGTGPRFCPSVEDKIVRFANKDSHPIFLEQEEWDSESMYVQGFSTSMPADVQIAALHTIPGLQNAEMIRPGYAVEYDVADPTQLYATGMSKLCDGLFLAGQINGTSGYEEAAGQGILAGINAARHAMNEQPVILSRDSSFIGVMMDDLVTKGVEDPYRMLTARAEHRLLLRSDNADQRLTAISREVGLCSDERWARYQQKMHAMETLIDYAKRTFIHPNDEDKIASLETFPLKQKMSLYDLLKRPEVDPKILFDSISWPRDLSQAQKDDVLQQIKLAAIYEGYIEIQQRLADRTRNLDAIQLPKDLVFEQIKGLSYECIDKLNRHRPENAGQASRIPGVRPADIALLVGQLKK